MTAEFTHADVTDVWATLEPYIDAELTRANAEHGSPVLPLGIHDEESGWAVSAFKAKTRQRTRLGTLSRADILREEVAEFLDEAADSHNQYPEAAQAIAAIIRLLANQRAAERSK